MIRINRQTLIGSLSVREMFVYFDAGNPERLGPLRYYKCSRLLSESLLLEIWADKSLQHCTVLYKAGEQTLRARHAASKLTL